MSTLVLPPSPALTFEMIVAFAPPWPRRLEPLASILAVWVASSTSSIFSVPLNDTEAGPTLAENVPS